LPQQRLFEALISMFTSFGDFVSARMSSGFIRIVSGLEPRVRIHAFPPGYLMKLRDEQIKKMFEGYLAPTLR
jgi:hypothetical protein